ncbi:hypothetical protein C8R44DRAFT_846786 [Mycena epipterygia]|nr:hypothetical protein C8R44DRAFT_846786 [Mycena epipterygia]
MNADSLGPEQRTPQGAATHKYTQQRWETPLPAATTRDSHRAAGYTPYADSGAPAASYPVDVQTLRSELDVRRDRASMSQDTVQNADEGEAQSGHLRTVLSHTLLLELLPSMERVNAELLFDEAGLPRAVPARQLNGLEGAHENANARINLKIMNGAVDLGKVSYMLGRTYVDLYFYIDTASRGRARGRCRERGLNDSPRAKASAGYAIKAQREVGDRLSFPSGGGNPKTKPLLALPLSAHSTPTPCCIAPLPAAYHPHTRVQIPDRDLPDHARTRACKGVQVGHFSVPAVSSAARGLPRGIRACTRLVDDSGGLIVSPVHGALGERVI